ncbi:MAG: hypothetical protein ACYC3I_14350 [Gemmataceae bacterium]
MKRMLFVAILGICVTTGLCVDSPPAPQPRGPISLAPAPISA